MKRLFAVFDIDGTLIRWQLYHALCDELARQGHIESELFETVREARFNWKRRVGEESFHAYQQHLIEVFDQALVDLSVKAFSEAADVVFDEYKEQVYTYTRDLLAKLKDKGYLLLAISGAPNIILGKMASFYGFDDYAGTEFPSRDGKYTGVKQLSVLKKSEVLAKLVKKHGASYKGSLAIGDSEHDIVMLSDVEKRIVFNPTKGLFKYACEQGWPIVLERKNMIYRLEKVNGKYELII